jgi:PAS domain S-box-containing protein
MSRESPRIRAMPYDSRLRLVIDAIPTMAWSLMPDGAVDFVNIRWLEYSGLSRESALEDPNRVVHPQDLARVMEKWRGDFAAGRPSELEMRLRRADGEYRWFVVRTVPLRDHRGHIVKWYGTSADIEDRKRANDALRQSEEKFRQIAENIREVFWMTMVGGDELLYVSPAYASIWGRSLQSLHEQPRSFIDAIHEDDRARAAAVLERRRNQAFEVEYRVVRPDGSVRWIRDRGFPVTDESGHIYRMAGIAEDITERRRAEAEIRVTAEMLKALTRRLVSMQEEERRDISRELHDRVGQGLTAMRINMDMVRTRLAERDDELIRGRIEDSLQLIESTFEAVRNLMYDLRPEMLDEHGLVASLRWHARQFGERTGIAVDVRGAEGARCAQEVEIAFFRIAQEALSNVARHSQATKVRIEFADGDGEVMLTVEDDGVGFDPDGNGRRKTGFGLTTMRERAEAVGGSLETASHSGRGVRITVRAPRGEPL